MSLSSYTLGAALQAVMTLVQSDRLHVNVLLYHHYYKRREVSQLLEDSGDSTGRYSRLSHSPQLVHMVSEDNAK